MKAVVIERFGDVKQLQLKDVPIPIPNDNEVQIKVAYAGVNPVDWKIREGYLQTRLPHIFSIILGWDVSGVVSAVGKDVNHLHIGDPVFAYCRKPTVQFGTYAEYICYEADHVVQKPKNISFAQAAAIPLTALTAWQALFDVAHLTKGQSVLIHAGAGGVGGMAIQLAKNAGAIIATTARECNHDYVKSLGADIAIDYSKGSFVKVIKDRFPNGVDVILDCVGGETLQTSFNAVKPRGWIVSIVERIDAAVAKKYNFQDGYVFVRPNGEELEKIAEMLTSGTLQPPVIEEFPLEKAAEAQEKVRTTHTKGKIVLKVE